MDILGIGPLELLLILIIALIVLGPSDMVKAGRTVGKFLRQVVTSPTWHAVTKTSQELRNLPNKLMRDAGLEEDFKDIQNATRKAIPPSINQDLSKWQEDINSWTTPPTIGSKSLGEEPQAPEPPQDVESPPMESNSDEPEGQDTGDIQGEAE